MLKKNKPDFFTLYSEKAQNVLQEILKKYVDFGLNQIRPDIISVDPFNLQGNTIEIMNEFGGMDFMSLQEGLRRTIDWQRSELFEGKNL